MMPTDRIPNFLLFGEELGETSPTFAHIETIAERSTLYDWEISPHRHLQSIQAMVVSNGHTRFSCDGEQYALDAPCFMVVPIGSVHGFRFSPDTTGHVLSLAGGFVSRASGAHDPLLNLLTNGGHGALPPAESDRAAWLCNEMLAIQSDWREPQRLFHALAEALLRTLARLGATSEEGHPENARLSGFRHLVELHMREHRSMDWYAARLNTTPKTLSRTCRQHLGCTPTDLIHRRMALEAQRLLMFANASVVQVAEELGFSDPSYFSRFYRRITGRRPKADKGRGPAAGVG